jgi:glutathione-specific gamma-glutamylcyclotransferase
MAKQVLTRALIEAGGIAAMVARDAPTMRILTDEERAASLHQTLAAKPAEDVWLFGYGSLIWNPMVHYVERRVGRIVGWRRTFCLSSLVGRGSVDNPGLVLGLDEGGDCTGVAFRISSDIVEQELETLWKREMLSGAYQPRWLELLDAQGERFGYAIAFTIDRAGQHYAGHLTRDEVLQRLANGAGALGSAADYLFQTCEGLRSHGIPDPELECFEVEVVALREAVTKLKANQG